VTTTGMLTGVKVCYLYILGASNDLLPWQQEC
jgi:hypothetical protein